jgi:hypothetical protein
MENTSYEYVTANLILAVNSSIDSENIMIPSGKVIAIAAIIAGNPGARILNLSILQNNQEIVRPADVRFSEKTNGGTFKDSLRPVDFQGGRTFEAKIVATETSATEVVAIQVLFMIEKPQLY